MQAKEKLLVRDRALFRIEREVFFKSAFLEWAKDWQSVACSGRRSLLLRSLDFPVEDFRSVESFFNALETRSATALERQNLERLVKLVKFIVYMQGQPESKQEFKWPRAFTCLSSEMKKSANVILLAKAENLLRVRFRNDDPTKERRLNNDDLNRAKAFVESILRGLSHELYL